MDEARRFLQDRKISVYMFPEGTRNKFSEDLLPFKRGAFYLAISAQVPIQPVVSCKIVKFFDMKNRVIRTGTAKIEVLEPISTKGMVATDVDKLLELTRDRMQEAYKRLNSQI
jgi:1-acyl-sn-glycerol-3-phosphate acyltransferase